MPRLHQRQPRRTLQKTTSHPADEAIAQAALAKTPNTQTVSLTPSSTKAGPAYLYPNPTLTPGAVLTTDASTICTPGYASSVRNVSTATKKQVYAEYSVSYPQPTGAYEVDHFIPLEIGGSNDITNLWLEPASPTPGFHQKDQFENFEHQQVCKGTISVAEAQSRMTSDWYLYWEEEVEGATPTTSLRQYKPRQLPCRRPPQRQMHHRPTTRPRITPRSTGILRPARAGRA